MSRTFLPLLIGLLLGGLITCGFTRRAPKTWEYKVIWMASPGSTQPPYVDDLNKSGAEGWHVVGALAGRGNGEGELILERQK